MKKNRRYMRKSLLIIKKVVEETLEFDDISLKTRRRELVRARQIYLYLCKKYTNYSLQTIGDSMRLNHATVLHSVKSVNNIIETKDNLYYEWVICCEKNLSEHINSFQDNEGEDPEKIIQYTNQKILELKIVSLEKTIDKIKLDLFVEKQRSKYKSEKHRNIEKYLDEIPTHKFDDFFETRIKPYVRMCQLNKSVKV